MKSNVYVACHSAIVGAATVISIQACGQSSTTAGAEHSQHQQGMTGGAPAGNSPSDQLHAIMMRPMGDMKMSGDVDKDFAKLMIPHHQGAIDMAKIELEHGKNEELKKMAQAIIDSQAKEIEILKKHAQ